jgi:hypothetical protein
MLKKTGIRFSGIMLQRGTDNGLQVGGFDRSVQVHKREIAAGHSLKVPARPRPLSPSGRRIVDRPQCHPGSCGR